MIVDDLVLIDILRGDLVVASPGTTTRWWLRLAMAARGDADGRLSRPLRAARITAKRIDDLPDYVSVVDPRMLTSVMADLLAEHRVGALGAEAIAAAAAWEQPLLISPTAATKPLRAAAKAYDVEVQIRR